MRKMKVIGSILLGMVFFTLTSCMNMQNAAPTVTEPITEYITAPVTSPVQAEPTDFEESIIFSSDENIPMPTGEKWYDWDSIGTYPNGLYFGHYVTGDEEYLYYAQNISNDNNLLGFELYRSDLDGGNRLLLDKVDKPQWNRNINCYKGYVYYNTPDGIFKIKNDGSGKEQITKEQADSMLVVDGKILCTFSDSFLYEIEGNKKTKLGKMGKRFLSFDNGIMYNGIHLSDNGEAEINAYGLASGRNKMLIEALYSYDNGLIARNHKLYYLYPMEEIYNEACLMEYDIQSGKESKLAKIVCNQDDNGVPSDNLIQFDRYFIYISYNPNTLWGYDTMSNKTYKLAQLNPDSPYIYLAVTQKYVYLGYDDPLEYRLFFRDGKVGLQRLKKDIQ